jgi:signal transduction histidine kinase
MNVGNKRFFSTIQGIKLLLLGIIAQAGCLVQSNAPSFIDTQKNDTSKLSIRGPFCNNDTTTIFKTVLPDTTRLVRFAIYIKHHTVISAVQYRLNTSTANGSWYQLPANKELIFHALNTGKYQLQVRETKSIDATTSGTVSLNFSIDKKWYKKISWQLLLALMLLLFFYGLVKAYNRRLFKNRIVLEQKIMERTEELHKSNEALKNKIAQLDTATDNLKQINMLRERLLNILSHDVHSPLRFSTMVGKAVLTKNKELSKEEIIDALSDINQTGIRILLLISNVLKWVEYQKENFTLQYSTENVMQMVNDKMEFFKFIANTKNILLINNTPPNTFIRTDKTAFGVIIQNLLNNGIKFTSEGEIEVSSQFNSDNFILTIADTGKGMPEETVNAIKFGHAVPLADTENLKGNGLGWGLIKELLDHLKGSFEITSSEGKGTIIKLLFPI